MDGCWRKALDEKDDEELGSHPCFVCGDSPHAWKDCTRKDTDEVERVDWKAGWRTYLRLKEHYDQRGQERTPAIWTRLAKYYEKDRDRNRRHRERDKAQDDRHPGHEAEVEHPIEMATGTTTTQASERTIVLKHATKFTPNRKVTVTSDSNESDRCTPPKPTAKPINIDNWRRASSSSDNSEDLRNTLTRMRIEEGKHQAERDIAETVKQRKRKNDITCEKSEYTYDDASANSDGGWPPEPANERQVGWGFFKIRAQDANGHIMEIQVPAYKKPRQGTSDNEITNTELILAEGYIIQQCRPEV